jgi:hypothetical protein
LLQCITLIPHNLNLNREAPSGQLYHLQGRKNLIPLLLKYRVLAF